MWTREQTDTLAMLLDALIPPQEEGPLPGAGELGLADHLAAAVGDHLPTAAALSGYLATPLDSGQAVTVLQKMETQDPDLFSFLLRHTYQGYYARPDVRGLMSLMPAPVHPGGYDVPSESAALLGELTAPVVRRGTCFRTVNEERRA